MSRHIIVKLLKKNRERTAKEKKREVICHVCEDTENLNKVTSKSSILEIKNIPTKKNLRQVASLANSKYHRFTHFVS